MSTHNYRTKIIKYLGEIKGGGNFVTHHTAGFVFPGLQVKNVGEISYPISEAQALELIQAAHKAPFGKGHDTIIDEKVRKVWEIDADQLTFNGDKWSKFLKTILNKIKPGLGLEGYSISAYLYKLLVYEEGGFFLPHKDSEKEKDMFGTLIIGLPSKHTGGEMIVRFDGEEKLISFEEETGNFSIPYAAFYADCEHEIKPVTSGYRVCLVYNLVKNDANKHIELIPKETTVSTLASLLKDRDKMDQEIPCIILLGHQYTPENFSAKNLKLNDRAKADALFRAAAKAGHYAKLCLVTSYITGSPEYSGYYGDDMDDVDLEIEEVQDESLDIEHWAAEGVPALPNVSFEENDLIVSFALKDGEPIVKESTGYMGNYGPDIMHWYHYGAVMIWSKAEHLKLLPLQNDTTKLEWIDYYAQNLSRVNKDEIELAENIVKNHIGQPQDRYEKPGYNAMINWMIARNDATLFLTIDEDRLQTYFPKIDVSQWVKLFEFFPTGTAAQILNRVTLNCTLTIIAQLLSVLRALAMNAKFDQLIAVQMKALPEYLPEKITGVPKGKLPLNNIALGDLLFIEAKHSQNEKWVADMAAALTSNKERNYINDALAPEALAYAGKTKLAYQLLLACKQDLQQRADNQPQPPADWTRQMPLGAENKKQWQLLKDFLASPVEHIFDYRKNQQERTDLENAIHNVTIDLKMETIRKGSPHTLRITKTLAAHHKAMKAWNEDVALLEKVNNKMKGMKN